MIHPEVKLDQAVIARIVDEAVALYLATGDRLAVKRMTEDAIARELLQPIAAAVVAAFLASSGILGGQTAQEPVPCTQPPRVPPVEPGWDRARRVQALSRFGRTGT